ncbi:MAG: hypothetical protein R2862_11980 [Thermoanaerobaculia bacterium]
MAPVALRGGSAAATAQWRRFLGGNLALYAERRNDPEDEVASGLSPYLHFGHLSVHQALAELAEREGWSPEDVARTASGRREGWWGCRSWRRRSSTSWSPARGRLPVQPSSRGPRRVPIPLPDWARATLARHAEDERPWLLLAGARVGGDARPDLERAAQRQLVAEGRIHNYLRMLWGKKVLEWSATPRDAVAR